MHINHFPTEILQKILKAAADANQHDGVSFTYGLSLPSPPPLQPAPRPVPGRALAKIRYPSPQRYVRGMLPPDVARWNAVSSIRQVYRCWHAWSLEHSMNTLYLKFWRGSERWCNLPQRPDQYPLYEIADDSCGPAVYRNPFSAISETAKLLRNYPDVAIHIRRLWINSFHTVDSDADIVSIIRSCNNLHSASLPSTVLRRFAPAELQELLVSSKTGNALCSLELQAVDFTTVQKANRKNYLDLNALASVDFSTLKRLKFIGDSTAIPITDANILAIAQTATALEEFHITGLGSISIQGVMAIVQSSHSTLRVLEHSPRERGGFFHPHPGYMSDSQHHICSILASCPRLEMLSISVPSMCASLFENPHVRWHDSCQVRAARLCDRASGSGSGSGLSRFDSCVALRRLLAAARALNGSHAASIVPAQLDIELFFLGCIFEPGTRAVHGVFPAVPGDDVDVDGAWSAWPVGRAPSRKGPYGSTGLYGKDDAELEEAEVGFERIGEAEFLRGCDLGRVGFD